MTVPLHPPGAAERGSAPLVEPEVAAWVESGLFVVVGTRDADLAPEVTRGWGPRILEGGDCFEVWLGSVVGRRSLDNLRDNGAIAMTCVQALDYRSLQLVGTCLEVGDEERAEVPAVTRQRELLGGVGPRIGILPLVLRNLLSWDPLVRVRARIERVYDQTPGPQAGRAL
jgi:hypothetical protein